MSAVREILAHIPKRTVRIVTVTCVTDTPLTVHMDGDTSVAVRARTQAGSVFAVGESGLAYWAPPSLPICFKTT